MGAEWLTPFLGSCEAVWSVGRVRLDPICRKAGSCDPRVPRGQIGGPPSGGRADRRNPERVVVFRRDMFPPGPFDGPCGTCLGIVFYLNDGLVAGFVHRIFHL